MPLPLPQTITLQLTTLLKFYSQSERFDEAVAECRKALKIKPDLAAAHNNLGAALIRSGQASGAALPQNSVDEAIGHY